MMRRVAVPVLLALCLQLALTALLLQPAAGKARLAAPAATHCVNPGGTGSCFDKIQDAINAASPGDQIDVATGTYTEHIEITKTVSIYGEGWSNTIINGNYSAPQPTVYVSSVSASTVISGVQITGGGDGTTTTDVRGGGLAIWYASPTIRNVWVFSCTALYGGGVFVQFGSPAFDNVPVWNSRAEDGGGYFLNQGSVVTMTSDLAGTNGTIWFNSATSEGGGVYIAPYVTATLAGLRINLNTANYGGGIDIEQNTHRTFLALNDVSLNAATWRGGGVKITAGANFEFLLNAINGNTAGSSGGGIDLVGTGTVQANWLIGNGVTSGTGGGMSIANDSSPTVRGNWFEGNSAGSGGGIWVQTGATPLVDANTFVTNTATLGGGFYLFESGPLTITNNIIARNKTTGIGNVGGGIWSYDSPGHIINNTIADNLNDGIHGDGITGTVIANNIIVNNQGVGLYVENTVSGMYTADYNDVFGNTMTDYVGGSLFGPNDLSVNPLFVAGGANLAEYYHITTTSPVSTTGSLAWAPARDIDSELRALGGSVSMGADEVNLAPPQTIYLPLILRTTP